jgi:hypothetical protein
MKAILPVALALAVAGCGLVRAGQTSRMDATEIMQVSDHDLCNPNAAGSIVTAERARRGLGDCSPFHAQCIAMGFQLGTQEYLQCRALLAQDDAARAAAANLQTLEILQMLNQQQPQQPHGQVICNTAPPSTMTWCQY